MTLPLTPELVARAVVASARSFGVDAVHAASTKGSHARRALNPAVVAIAWATGRSQNSICELLRAPISSVYTAKRLSSTAWMGALEAAKAACLEAEWDVPSPSMDAALVVAALGGADLRGCALAAAVPMSTALDRMRTLGRSLARAIGGGFIDPPSTSGKPDGLIFRGALPVPPAVAAEAPAAAIEGDKPLVVAPKVDRDATILKRLEAGEINSAVAKSMGLTPGTVAGVRQRAKIGPQPSSRSGRSPSFPGLARLGRESQPLARAKSQLSAGDRALIDAALAAGRVKAMPTAGAEDGHSPGLRIAQPKPLEFDRETKRFTRRP